MKLAALAALMSASAAAAPSLTVDVSPTSKKVSPHLYGLMTEEINHCYDGGLYAELLQNRAFLDDPKEAKHWEAWSPPSVGGSGAEIGLDPQQPLNKEIPASLRVEVMGAGAPDNPAGAANEGYWGIPVTPGTTYRASFWAKGAPNFTGPVVAAIVGADGKSYASAEVPKITPQWARYEVKLTTASDAAPTTAARFVVGPAKPGTIWLGLASLFPPTWKDRPNGLRKDLMQMLVDLKPKFLRFPGGNYLEGDRIEDRFKWWETLGPIETRPGHQGPWGYRSTDGMGMLEFLTWCEDMGAEPVLGLYAGYSLKGDHVKPGKDLEPFVQEALDEIEYVVGGPNTKWGARRVKDGHPAPFKLTYVEIGNEDWFDKSGTYDARFAQFHDAIKRKYPQLQTISSIGLEHDAKIRVHTRKPDVLDEHYYMSSDEFIKRSPDYYAKYSRSGPKIFVGEWAAHEDPAIKPWSPGAKDQPPTPSFKAALGDAALMADMERNSDIVAMHCYAPLFVNVNPGARQWRPNLIGYDALRSYGSPSYHAFKMFSANLGDQILKLTPSDTAVQASATRDSRTGDVFLKLVNPTDKEEKLDLKLKGFAAFAPKATALVMAARPEDTNTIDEPEKVAPKASEVTAAWPNFSYTMPPHSIAVLTLKPAKLSGL